MTKIVYMHGYGGSSHGETAVALKQLLEAEGYEFEAIDYTVEEVETSPLIIIQRVMLACKSADEVILVGSSLGGFFAHYAGDWKFCDKVLTINPSIMPYFSLKKYGIDTNAYLAFIRPMQIIATRPSVPTIVVVGDQDEVVNPYDNGRQLKYVAEVVNIEMGHRLSSKYYGLVVDLIKRLDNTVIDCTED